MHLPQGFYRGPDNKQVQRDYPTHHDHSSFIKLKENLYGGKQAARNCSFTSIKASFPLASLYPKLTHVYTCYLIAF
jgi:hypothetical protein